MYAAELFFKNSYDLKHFSDKINLYHDLEIYLVSGIYTMNAHSIIGVLSLDISKPVQIQVLSENIPEAFLEDIKPFLYDF